MKDVRAMKKIFTSTMLEPVLAQLTLRNKAELHKTWSDKNSDRLVSQQLIRKMGKDCSKKMAVRLNDMGVSYDQLQQGFKDCSTEEEFHQWLRESGVTDARTHYYECSG